MFERIYNCRRRYFALSGLLLIGMLIGGAPARAADFTRHFAKYAKDQAQPIDHSAWTAILRRYVQPDGAGVNRVDYAKLKREATGDLGSYLAALQKVDVTRLSRREQFAFWINLHNAATVKVVLDNHPVVSIRDIDISPGLLADGPWGAKVVAVNGVKLSLDNIEHDILRKFWRDPRVHFAVNCASVGCPNLAREAYTGARLDSQLDQAARAYVNNPRGVRFNGSRLTASKIFDWYGKDFGSSETALLKRIADYAAPELARRLRGASGIDHYEYDWTLNGAKR